MKNCASRILYFFGMLCWFFGWSCSPKIKILPYEITAEISKKSDKKQGSLNRTACRNWENYLPDPSHPEYLPMKYLRVNFHILNSTDSTANFRPGAAQQFCKELLRVANAALDTNVANWRSPSGTAVLPRRYQYILTSQPDDDGFRFYFDDNTYYHVGSGKYQNNYSRDVIDRYAVGADSIINIFLMAHHKDSLKSREYRSTWQGIALGTSLKLAGVFESGHAPDAFEGLLNHEIGHILSLSHAWSEDGCPDTDPHPNKCFVCDGQPPCDTFCTNNMMDYNEFQLAMTPCQIGRVHAYLALENTRIRKCMLPTWCQPYPKKKILIKKREVWRGAKDLEGDIEIASGGELVLCCRVSMSPGSKILVRVGGKIVMEEGAHLHQSCGKNWQGIFVEQKKQKQGEVEILGDVKIENIGNEILR